MHDAAGFSRDFRVFLFFLFLWGSGLEKYVSGSSTMSTFNTFRAFGVIRSRGDACRRS